MTSNEMQVGGTPPGTVKPEQQLALQLFADLAPVNKGIGNAETDVGFYINRALAEMRDLNLVTRKALLGCYFLAATSSGAQGNDNGLFNFDLGFYKWLIAYDSSQNLAHLRRALRDAQKGAIELNLLDPNNPNDDVHRSVPLLGEFTIGRGRMEFEVPRRILMALSNPNTNGLQMFMSLRIQANLKSIYAQTLYAKLAPEQERTYTDWMTLDEFSKMMNIQDYKWATEFKYLKRDVINVAIAQINNHADFTLRLETMKEQGSNKIAQIRFEIKKKAEGSDPYMTEKMIYETLRNQFSLANADLEEIMSHRDRYSNSDLLDAIKYTQRRLDNTKLEPLRFPGKYFMDALEKGFKAHDPVDYRAQQATHNAAAKARAAIREKAGLDSPKPSDTPPPAGMLSLGQVEQAVAAFEALSDGDKDGLWSELLDSPKLLTAIKWQRDKANKARQPEPGRDLLIQVKSIRFALAELVVAKLGLAG